MPRDRSAPKITFAILRRVLNYSPDTGIFVWVIKPSVAVNAGDIAGNVGEGGYIKIGFGNRLYFAHQLAWLWMTGSWPRKHVDHKNGKPSDNRWRNLREATSVENMRNGKRPNTNTSGFKGVSWHKRHCRFRAYIRVNGRLLHLGYYTDAEKAHAAYVAAAEKFFGEFSCDGTRP